MALEDMETRYDKLSGFYVRTAKGCYGFVAWGRKEPFEGDDILDEPGLVYFRLGPTRDAARASLLAEITFLGNSV